MTTSTAINNPILVYLGRSIIHVLARRSLSESSEMAPVAKKLKASKKR
jgi:hypothetical protein